MSGLTRQLAAFAAGLEFGRLPPGAVEIVTRGAIDCVGVMILGRDEPVVDVLRGLTGAGAEAHLLFDAGIATALDATLVNATAAHALDYDDTGIDGHPSVILVPVVLAEGERLGVCGRDAIAAYVAGYETWAELSARDADRLHGKGWHPTAVYGTLAAAAAAARLARLDADATAHALGIAASMAGGLVANFGSMTKPFQAGRAAQNGLLAARLAGRGMTAATDALEHRAGFLAALSPGGHIRPGGEIAAGRDWHIVRLGLNVKRYPVCYALHRAVDAMLDLATAHDLRADEVIAVEVHIGRHQAGMLRSDRPRTALDAKFSAQFAMAAGLLARQVGPAQLTDAFVESAAVQALLPRVRVVAVDGEDPDEPLFAPADTVVVHRGDGRVLRGPAVRHALGHARNPVALDALQMKFNDCVGDVLTDARRERLFTMLSRLDTLADLRAIFAA